jgi:poly(A) polymerase
MLKRFNTFLKTAKTQSKLAVVEKENHSINFSLVSKDAVKIVKTLQKAGYEAYIVGGSIRDLLLDLAPKDFDVATNAKPLEIKSLFRRSRIVGRRFQIVHVQYNREIIEVTTFRSNSQPNSGEVKNTSSRQKTDTGLLTRDNVFGTIEEDAARRDLTVNALYYDPCSETIYDFADGLKDLKNRVVKIIGDPTTRYSEDPVRLLRVIRFSAKLDFSIASGTANPINKLGGHLRYISSPRLFDESLKLFMSGKGLSTYKLLKKYSLFEYLIPQAKNLIKNNSSNANFMFEQALLNTDKRIRSNQHVTPAFIYAALLWPSLARLTRIFEGAGNSPSYSQKKAASEVIQKQTSVTAIPKRFTIPMREIWDLQIQMQRRGGKRAQKLFQHPRFRAAYDFILLREQAGEDLDNLGEWWTLYQEASLEEKEQMSKDVSNLRKKVGRVTTSNSTKSRKNL